MRRETSFSVSRKRRSRRLRDVTYLPSLPANGESLTEKVISIVGADIFTKGSGVGSAGEHMVSPIVISPMPDMAIILPASASVTGSRSSPLN